MKTINQYRKTRNFCIDGTIVADMALIHAEIASGSVSPSQDYTTVISVGQEPKGQDGPRSYTVRVLQKRGVERTLFDQRVRVTVAKKLEVLETVVISQFD